MGPGREGAGGAFGGSRGGCRGGGPLGGGALGGAGGGSDGGAVSPPAPTRVPGGVGGCIVNCCRFLVAHLMVTVPICSDLINYVAEGGNKSRAKLLRQMEARGWSNDDIWTAYKKGEQVAAKNFTNGNPATRYIHPETGKSVIIDDITGQIVEVGGRGFAFDK